MIDAGQFGTNSANNGCRSTLSGEKGLRKSIESHPPNRPVAATNITDSKTFRLMPPLRRRRLSKWVSSRGVGAHLDLRQHPHREHTVADGGFVLYLLEPAQEGRVEGFGPIQAEVGGHRVEATEQVSADGHLHSDNGVWMSWHVAVLTPARWGACDGRPLAGPTASIGSLRTALYRTLTAVCVDCRPNHIVDGEPILDSRHTDGFSSAFWSQTVTEIATDHTKTSHESRRRPDASTADLRADPPGDPSRPAPA